MMTYMNYAGLAPLRFQSYLKGFLPPELMGNILLPGCADQLKRLRVKVARWIGCKPEQVAFVPNTSLAITLAAYSLDWQQDDVVLYPADDFPANVQPWHQVKRFGANAIGVQDWSGPWPEKTRMVSLSTVDYSTGIEQPWREVVTRAKAQNIWTCVDAVQSAGIQPSWHPDIDFWCAGAQKWLVSGLGVAILILSDRVLEHLSSPFPNWLNLKMPAQLDSGLDDTARGWELGWVAPTALSRLEASLDYFQRIGWDKVTEQVKLRRDFLHVECLEMGWHVASCPERWSGLVSLEPGHGLAEQMVKDGYQHRIVVAQRGQYVRLSPHLFNSMRQLRKVSHWLEQCYVKYGRIETVQERSLS
jgi:cysteine desulfurase/selenocysteine lyase